jgi:hypothetical protein
MTTKQNQIDTATLDKSVEKLVRAFGELDRAITPRGSGNTLVTGGHDATGGYVTSLTEAVMGVTAGLCKIAEAIHGLSQSVRDTKDNNHSFDE